LKAINLILPNDISEISAGKNRILSYINVLKKQYEINLITFSKNRNIKIEEVNLYLINYIKVEKNNFFKRTFDEIKLSYKLVLLSNKIKSDVTLLTIPSMFLLPIGLFIKTKKIVDIRDIQWEYLNNKFIKQILKVIMLNSLKFYDKITVTNEYELKYLENYNPILISNGISQNQFEKLQTLHINPKEFSVTYIGNIGIAQDLIILCKVAKKLPLIKFKLIGDGVEFKRLQNYIKENNIKNIEMPGKMDWEEIKKEYQKSSVLFAKLNENFAMAMPSKLYEYASIGLPIIYIGEGQAREFVENLENSYVIEDNEEELVKILQKLKTKKFKISQKNIKFIKDNYIREEQSLKLINILQRIEK